MRFHTVLIISVSQPKNHNVLDSNRARLEFSQKQKAKDLRQILYLSSVMQRAICIAGGAETMERGCRL
jgi:hypothetical protein